MATEATFSPGIAPRRAVTAATVARGARRLKVTGTTRNLIWCTADNGAELLSLRDLLLPEASRTIEAITESALRAAA